MGKEVKKGNKIKGKIKKKRIQGKLGRKKKKK